MNQGKGPFIHKLTEASKQALDDRIKKALDASGFAQNLEALEHDKQLTEFRLSQDNLGGEERKELEKYLQKVKVKIDEKLKERKVLEDRQRQEQAAEAQTETGGVATEKVKKSEGMFSCNIL